MIPIELYCCKRKNGWQNGVLLPKLPISGRVQAKTQIATGSKTREK